MHATWPDVRRLFLEASDKDGAARDAVPAPLTDDLAGAGDPTEEVLQ